MQTRLARKSKFRINYIPERILCMLMIGMLTCMLMMTWKIYMLEKNRIPKPVINLNIKHKGFSGVPPILAEVTVMIKKTDGGGSGVVVGKKMILTNQHVIGDNRVGDKVWVYLSVDGKTKAVVGEVVDKDHARDLALIRVDDFDFVEKARVAREYKRWGMPIIVVGSPLGQMNVPTQGFYVRHDSSKALIACMGFFGNSGGPVFDAKTGELVALVRKLVGAKVIRTSYSVSNAYPFHLFHCVPTNMIGNYLEKHKDLISKD